MNLQRQMVAYYYCLGRQCGEFAIQSCVPDKLLIYVYQLVSVCVSVLVCECVCVYMCTQQ